MLDLYLIRHAESEMNNHNELVGGRSNGTKLSERGKHQAILLGKRLKDSGIIFNEIYSSTADRAIETAQKVCEIMGYSIDQVVKTDELLELDQGEWEGKIRAEIYTPSVLEKINSDNWNFKPPNGESQKMVEDRVLQWVNKYLVSKYSKDYVVGVFSHGLAIKCLLRGIMDFSPKITYKVVLDNTSITRLKYSDKGWHLITVNDAGHLMGEERISDFHSSSKK